MGGLTETEQVLVDLSAATSVMGGVLPSYHLPGWAAAGPIRHLLLSTRMSWGQRSKSDGAKGQRLGGIHSKIYWLDTIPVKSPPFLSVFEIGKQNPYYWQYEYFNRDGNLMHFSDMQNWLEDAKSSYACSQL